MSFRSALLGFASLCLSAPPALADEGEGETWSRYTSPDEVFSVEMPCSAEDIQKYKVVPANMSIAVSLDPESRILCLHNEMMLVASIMEVPEDELGGVLLFDLILQGVTAQPDELDNPAALEIDGRRAFKNSETDTDYMAQTGIVEVAPNRVLLSVVGGPLLEDGARTTMEQTVDRFLTSIELAAQ